MGMVSSPDPTTISNQNKNAILSSKFQKTVTLHDWWLIKAENTFNGRRLAVGGSSSKGNRTTRIFSSAPILKRYDLCTLETVDGLTVSIKGCINKTHTHENGIPFEVCNHFLIGFPYNWEDFCYHCGEEPMPTNIFFRSNECGPKQGESKENSSEEKSEAAVVDSHVQMNAEVSAPFKGKSTPKLDTLGKLKHLNNRLMAMRSSERKRRNFSNSLPQQDANEVPTPAEKKSCAVTSSSISNVDLLRLPGEITSASQNDAPMVEQSCLNREDVTAKDNPSRNCSIGSGSYMECVNPTAANMVSLAETPNNCTKSLPVQDSPKNSDAKHNTRKSCNVVVSSDKMANQNEPTCPIEVRKSKRLKTFKGTGSVQDNAVKNCLIESGSGIEGVDPSKCSKVAPMEDPVDHNGFGTSGRENLTGNPEAVSSCNKMDSDNEATIPAEIQRKSKRLKTFKGTGSVQDNAVKNCLIESGSGIEGVDPSKCSKVAPMEDPVDHDGFGTSGGENLTRNPEAVSSCNKMDSDNEATFPAEMRRKSKRLKTFKGTGSVQDNASKNCLIESDSGIEGVDPSGCSKVAPMEDPVDHNGFGTSGGENLTRNPEAVSSCNKMDNDNEATCPEIQRRSKRLKTLKGTGSVQDNASKNCLIESGSGIEGVDPSEYSKVAPMEDPVDHNGFETSGGENLTRNPEAISSCYNMISDNEATCPAEIPRRSNRLKRF